MTEPSGLAPVVDPEPLAETALCRHCAELIRYWPAQFVWRHVVARAHDHEPLPMTESEARAMWGDR